MPYKTTAISKCNHVFSKVFNCIVHISFILLEPLLIGIPYNATIRLSHIFDNNIRKLLFEQYFVEAQVWEMNNKIFGGLARGSCWGPFAWLSRAEGTRRMDLLTGRDWYGNCLSFVKSTIFFIYLYGAESESELACWGKWPDIGGVLLTLVISHTFLKGSKMFSFDVNISNSFCVTLT